MLIISHILTWLSSESVEAFVSGMEHRLFSSCLMMGNTVFHFFPRSTFLRFGVSILLLWCKLLHRWLEFFAEVIGWTMWKNEFFGERAVVEDNGAADLYEFVESEDRSNGVCGCWEQS